MEMKTERATPWLDRAGAIAGVIVPLLMTAGGILPQVTAKSLLLQFSFLPLPLWLIAVHLGQRHRTGRLGSVSFWLALSGAVAFAAYLVLVFNIGRLTTGTPRQPAYFAYWWEVILKAAPPLFISTMLIFSLITMKAGVFPPAAAALWMTGLSQCAVLVSPGPLLALAGMVWGGYTLWSGSHRRAALPLTGAATSLTTEPRLPPLDALRGLIMILMAVDHMRLAVMPHPAEIWDAAMEPVQSAPLFLTRLVTHFCAPGFFFLMGTGAVLFAESRLRSGWSRPKIAGHLMLRGLVLIAVEQFLVYPFQSGGGPNPFLYTVLFGLGASLMLCGLLVGLGRLPLLVVALATIVLSQFWPSIFTQLGLLDNPAVRIIFVPGSAGRFFSLYSVFSWAGVAFLGMAFGRHLAREGDRAFRHALFAGLAFLPLFVLVRALGGFGNFQPPAGPGVLDFLNMVKYPPSLAFLLLTLGIDLVMLYLFSRAGGLRERWGRPLLVFGSTALFFYVAHFTLYFSFRSLFFVGGRLMENVPLWAMYAGWAAGLPLLYLACRLFRDFKSSTAPSSAWRLF